MFNRVLSILFLFIFSVMAAAADELIIYSGRSKSLVEPIIHKFEKKTGVRVKVNYGKTTPLAAALMTEGEKSPAALFWAQDAGALGAVSKKGLFAELPQSIQTKVPPIFRHADRLWVATSGRARVLAYSTERVRLEQLPKSIFDLTQPMWKGRVGWAPTNASFQAFVTAMRRQVGEQQTEEWLRGMKANDTKIYAKNTPIIEALAAGEIDIGLPNHYYLLRFKKGDANFPAAQTFFQKGNPGNLVNIAGIGLLKNAKNREAALKFIEFLLSETTQQYFVNEVFEYPVVDGVDTNKNLLPLSELLELVPNFNLSEMDDIEGTVLLLKRVEVL